MFISARPVEGSESIFYRDCDCGQQPCRGVVAAVSFQLERVRFTLDLYATGDCERCETVCEEWGILELAISPTTKRMNARTATELGAAYRVDHKLLTSIGALRVDELTGPGGPTTNGAAQ